MSSIDKTRLNTLQETMLPLNISNKYLEAIEKENSWQPYHNFQHLVTTANKVKEAADHYELPTNETRLLVIAAILHDIGHSADNTITDIENVMISAEKAADILANDNTITSKETERIINLIISTENMRSFVIYDTLQGLLKDADMLQTLEPDHEIWFTRLSEELKTPITAESTMSFLKSYKTATTWGQEKVAQGIKKLEGSKHE